MITILYTIHYRLPFFLAKNFQKIYKSKYNTKAAILRVLSSNLCRSQFLINFTSAAALKGGNRVPYKCNTLHIQNKVIRVRNSAIKITTKRREATGKRTNTFFDVRIFTVIKSTSSVLHTKASRNFTLSFQSLHHYL